MYGNDSTGQSSANSNDNKSMMVLFGSAFLTGAAYYAPRFFCPPVSEQEKEKKRKFAEIAREFNTQMKQEKEDCELIREALRNLDIEEKASLTDKKVNHPEIYKKLEALVHSDRGSSDIYSLAYKKEKLQELLSSYPHVPENIKYTYEILREFCEESAEHHSQVKLLAEGVLEHGYQGVKAFDEKAQGVNVINAFS